jgi:hypothetical protein
MVVYADITTLSPLTSPRETQIASMETLFVDWPGVPAVVFVDVSGGRRKLVAGFVADPDWISDDVFKLASSDDSAIIPESVWLARFPGEPEFTDEMKAIQSGRQPASTGD